MARIALDFVSPKQELRAYPPVEQWDDWMEYESKEWPRRVEKHYTLVPTVCFNCEAGCGLLAYIDKETLQTRKLEGNPEHPGSRGRNCAKGPATYNQITDPERILFPLKRAGKRGEGKWVRVTWDQVLDDLAARIRQALVQDRKTEVMYHVGRPGHDGYIDRVLQAWGIDGHNSHTNVCSSAARLGYSLWHGFDRPSPDHANARFILLISAHLETGHYFNPHAQRIIEAKMRGAKLAVVDTRLSNTASMADYWLPAWPGSEAAMLLAMALVILKENLCDREFMRRWTNWEEWMRDEPNEPNVPTAPNQPNSELPITNYSVDDFIERLKRHYAQFTPEFAEKESGIPAKTIVEIAHEIGRAGSAFASHVWRSAATGNLGGWQVARCLEFLNVLVGAVATPGGTAPSGFNKFVPTPPLKPPPQKVWNELLMPKEYPLSYFELSFLLPHFLKEGRGKLAMYFTRVYNPVWTNPDGATWMEVLSDEKMVECHAALTPTWSETAWFADYVLPMGHGPERHDLMSYETHAAQWIAFRQPVRRVAMEKQGKQVNFTYEANPGQVWEEDEFWIELSWRIDPDGLLGIRKYFESPFRPGEKMRIDEYYRWIFENSVPGLPESAQKEGLAPLDYMRKYGAFTVKNEVYNPHEKELGAKELEGTNLDPQTRVVTARNGAAIGVEIDGKKVVGFPTPSRKLEIYSRTLKDWKWGEFTLPGYIQSHVHPSQVNRAQNEFVLLSTFRLPTMIHTRSANAKWLVEISHKNPAWLSPQDARGLGVKTGDLIRVTTDIGYFVDKVWVTEGIRPGVVACSHHMGRWRLDASVGSSWLSAQVKLEHDENKWKMRQLEGVKPFKSSDPDSMRIWWSEVGVHQNLTMPVHPDPISGMHCWHQKVRVEKAQDGDRYGDIFVDTQRSHEIYKEWLALTRPAPGPDNLRRPLWMPRAVKPDVSAYKISE